MKANGLLAKQETYNLSLITGVQHDTYNSENANKSHCNMEALGTTPS